MNLSPLPIQKFFDNNGAPLAGGLLFTYVAGTSTKIATYTDSAGGTPNTNPIVLNFRGECSVWMDPTKSYKLVLAPSTDTDPPANAIWTADNIRPGVDYSTLTANFIGQILWPRSAAETAAGVTPVNYGYEYGNVLRYGADRTGVVDSTAAFNNASAVQPDGRAGQRVWVPNGIYNVSNIEVVNGMWIEGETNGSGANNGDATVLVVGTNGAGAFRHSTSTDKFWITIQNMHIRAGTGVTNARGFLQSDRAFYTVSINFVNVSTDRSLLVGYEGFFLEGRWNSCWDGYSGSPPSGQQHHFIDCHPAVYGQVRTTNLCSVTACSIFGATSGAAAAIDVSYGVQWTIDGGTQLEDMDTLAIRMRGVLGGSLSSVYFENIRAAQLSLFDISPAPSAQGCGNWAIRDVNATVNGFTGTGLFAFGVSSAINVSFDSVQLQQVGAGVTLVTGTSGIVSATNVRALSGAGASGSINIPVNGSGSFTVTLTGVTTTVTATARYEQNGKEVTLYVPSLVGTSNATTCTITGVPASLRPAVSQGNRVLYIQDNGVAAFGFLQLDTSGVFSVRKSATATGTDWTAAGTKAVGDFNYTYSLSA